MSKRYLIVVSVMFFGLVACSGQPTSSKERDPEKRFLEGSPEHSIPLEEIHHGGPPVDGIPALVNPAVVSVEDAGEMRGSDQLMVVVIDGQARGYPLRILDRHELVNDEISGRPFLVTFCPLCGSGVVFDRRINTGNENPDTFEFGVSGLLYQSDVLLYDRTTDSLWSQLRGEAVLGPLTGTSLGRLTHTRMAWKTFQKRYPEGDVLSFETGYSRSYERRAYQGYRSSDRTMFPVNNEDGRLPNKADVLGISEDGLTVAVTRKELRKRNVVHFQQDDRGVLFLYNGGAPYAYEFSGDRPPQYRNEQLVGPDGGTWTVAEDQLVSPDGQSFPRIAHIESYWFAWATFHPETELVSSGRR